MERIETELRPFARGLMAMNALRACLRAWVLPLCVLLAASGCGGAPEMPRRSSPSPAPVADQPAGIGATDAIDPRLAWFDLASRRVLSFRGGRIVPVQDRVFDETPSMLRVLPDDTVVMQVGDTVMVQPARGDGWTAALPEYAALQGIDGRSPDAVWVLAQSDRLRLCRVDRERTTCVTDVPEGTSGRSTAFHLLAVAADGSVYVNNDDALLLRWVGGQWRRVGALPDGEVVRTLRPSGAGVLAVTFVGVFSAEGDSIRAVWTGDNGVDAVGTPDDLVVLTDELASGANACLTGHCGTTQYWRQRVWTRVRPSGAVELGHEDCDLQHETSSPGCSRTTLAMGVDGDRVTILGKPLRTLRR